MRYGLFLTVAAAASSRLRRTARHAEPVTAVAAAAAAAAAAKAAGAAMGAKAATAGAATASKAAGMKASVAAKAKIASGTKASAAAKGANLVGSSTGSAAGVSQSTKSSDSKSDDMNFDPSEQVGVTAPLGYFDPLGFSKMGLESDFRNFRTAEIKHGRVAMLATVGAVVQHYVKFPGFENVPAGMDAVETPPGTYGFGALFLILGYLETTVWTEDPSKEPGNFGDPAGLGMYTKDMRLKELNNGRMAMFAAIGIIVADIVTGRDGVEQLSALLNPTEIVKDVYNPL